MTEQEAICAIKYACNWNGSGQYTSDEFTEAKRIVCEATEKQTPKKTTKRAYTPNGTLVYGHCPDCDLFTKNFFKYCGNCGQALDWSDAE